VCWYMVRTLDGGLSAGWRRLSSACCVSGHDGAYQVIQARCDGVCVAGRDLSCHWGCSCSQLTLAVVNGRA
jgi:hypothetical protein